MLGFILTGIIAISFVWGFLLGDLRRARLASRGRLDIEDEHRLRNALHVWVKAYSKAKPTGKYFKRREKDLYDACCIVGTMWLPTKE